MAVEKKLRFNGSSLREARDELFWEAVGWTMLWQGCVLGGLFITSKLKTPMGSMLGGSLIAASVASAYKAYHVVKREVIVDRQLYEQRLYGRNVPCVSKELTVRELGTGRLNSDTELPSSSSRWQDFMETSSAVSVKGERTP